MNSTMVATCRVMLVDDVADLRRLVRLVLERSGDFTVVAEAGDGAEAISLASEHQPDLVLLDLSMPGMDGLEALPLLREATPSATIAILSGFEESQVAASALALGAAAYLQKGLSPDALLARVREVVDGATRQGGARAAEAVGDVAATEPPRLSDADLVRIAAHDLRGPVAVIAGFGETLTASWDRLEDAERRATVGRMVTQARVLHTMCDNLLAAHLAAAGEVDVDLTVEQPAALLDRLVELLRPIAGARALTLVVPPDLPVVLVDGERLRQVLANLILNAVRFAPADEEIELAARASVGGVVFEVADRGPGIPPADRQRVFQKDVRLSTGGSGTGLGLFICSTFVGAMGGRTWVEDRDGGGTRICCWLPSP